MAHYDDDEYDQHQKPQEQHKSNIIDLWTTASSTEMNLPQTLLFNIRISNYFKEDLFELKTYDSVLVEITEQVDDVRPFESGSDTKPHVSMILLYKLFTLRLTRKQLTGILAKKTKKRANSWAYVRAIGFLYVRFCMKPADMWEFFGPFVTDDSDTICVLSGEDEITIGEFVRSIIKDQKFLGVLFPRIPQTMLNTLKKQIREAMGEENDSHASGRYIPGSNRGKHDKYEDRYYGRDRGDDTIDRRTRRSNSRDYEPNGGWHARNRASVDERWERGRKRYRGDDARRDYHTRDKRSKFNGRYNNDGDGDGDGHYARYRSRSRSRSPAESRFSAPPIPQQGNATGQSTTSRKPAPKYSHPALQDRIVFGGSRR